VPSIGKYTVRNDSEKTITIVFGDVIDLEINRKVFRLFHHLSQNRKAHWLDLIPAYATLTIVLDTEKVSHKTSLVEITSLIENYSGSVPPAFRKLSIPVCYDSKFAPDITRIAAQKKISVEQVIAWHLQTTYHVYMIGFLPGFPYMGSVDKRVASPRLEKPRLVEEGSVGIAGEQTGIYPLASPGGWNIIGKTPLKLFDANLAEPVLFQPGDEVRFFSITQQAFTSFDLKKFNPIVHEF
jgi:inhibitor of KinA